MKMPSPLDVSPEFEKVHRILLLRAEMEREEFTNRENARKQKLENEQREEAIRKRKEAHRLEKMERLKGHHSYVRSDLGAHSVAAVRMRRGEAAACGGTDEEESGRIEQG